MKKLSIILGITLILLNVLILYLITSIGQNTMIISSSVVLTTFLLIFISQSLNIKDGYKTSLPFLFAFNGIIEYVLSFLIHEELKDNAYLITIIILFVIQSLILVICANYGQRTKKVTK